MQKFIDFLVSEDLPFSIAESPRLRELLDITSRAAPGQDLPIGSAKTVKKRIMDASESAVQKLQVKLSVSVCVLLPSALSNARQS